MNSLSAGKYTLSLVILTILRIFYFWFSDINLVHKLIDEKTEEIQKIHDEVYTL
jgi:hypothetical protein